MRTSNAKIAVIGQGIAGTLLAWELQRKGAVVHVFDAGKTETSSRIAAGVINPVTGKRFVKSWRFDTLYATAKRTYQSLETQLGISVWHERAIVRLLQGAEEVNNWSARCALPDYAAYLGEMPDAGAWAPFLQPGFQVGLIKDAARVWFTPLLDAFRTAALAQGVFFQQNVDTRAIEALLPEYDFLIFCDGYQSSEHDYFSYLPWQLAKGEALFIRFQDARSGQITQMLKRNNIIVPIGDNLFWAGGSYKWHYEDLLPSAGEKEYILHNLSEFIAAPFEIVGHRAAVRPTVKDRRPFVGLHPEMPKIGIFNGLGTKGALLAPYFAAHFAAHLLDGSALDEAVDIKRIK